MPRTDLRWAGAVLVAALALVGCSDDDGGTGAAGTTETASLDPGVTFTDDVTVPSSVPPGATTTTARPGEVVTEPNEVPEQFPGSFPVPEGAEVEIGSTGQAEGELRFAVDYAIADERPQAVFDFYRDAVAEAGFAVLLEDSDGQGQNFIGQLVFETDTYVGNVLISGDGGRGVLLTLTATMPD